MKILLIRHGETTGDINGQYGGWFDDHLTELGQKQLQKTAQQLRGVSIDKIFSSTLIRAKESTEIINKEVQAEVEFLDGLRERNYGVLGGLTKEEALDKYPEAVEAHKDPSNTDPKGEPQADFIKRVVDAFASICLQSHNTVVIVAHGGPIKVILTHLSLPLPERIGDGEIIEVNC